MLHLGTVPSNIGTSLVYDVDPDVMRAYEESLKKQTSQWKEGDYLISTHYISESEGYCQRLEYYLRFDETILEQMSKMGWSRKQTTTKYIPMCIVMHEQLYAAQ